MTFELERQQVSYIIVFAGLSTALSYDMSFDSKSSPPLINVSCCIETPRDHNRQNIYNLHFNLYGVAKKNSIGKATSSDFIFFFSWKEIGNQST